MQAGVKGIPITFLMTDNQIVKEKFLVYINDLLSTGYIADLCAQVSPTSTADELALGLSARGLNQALEFVNIVPRSKLVLSGYRVSWQPVPQAVIRQPDAVTEAALRIWLS